MPNSCKYLSGGWESRREGSLEAALEKRRCHNWLNVGDEFMRPYWFRLRINAVSGHWHCMYHARPQQEKRTANEMCSWKPLNRNHFNLHHQLGKAQFCELIWLKLSPGAFYPIRIELCLLRNSTSSKTTINKSITDVMCFLCITVVLYIAIIPWVSHTLVVLDGIYMFICSRRFRPRCLFNYSEMIFVGTW